MPKRAPKTDDSIERLLAELDELPADRAAQAERLESALAHKHYRVVAKAARLAADALRYDLVPALRAAYARFLGKPVKTDPSCYAKKAIVRALVALDHDDAEFFAAGLGLVQLEPVWGGTADTAADVRGTCALGLVASGHPRALVDVARLLYDPERDARLGAVRAVANGTPREAELLLRSKILAGDAEGAIVGECFSALLAVAPEESLPFVAPFVAHADGALRELAALALGESRAPGALEILRAAWSQVIVDEGLRGALITAAAAHRSEAAFDWLLELAADPRPEVAELVLEALAPYRHNARLTERLGAVLARRGEPALERSFNERWGSD